MTVLSMLLASSNAADNLIRTWVSTGYFYTKTARTVTMHIVRIFLIVFTDVSLGVAGFILHLGCSVRHVVSKLRGNSDEMKWGREGVKVYEYILCTY